MKILQINCVFKKGSTGKITEDIHNYLLENSVDSIVCYGRGQVEKDKKVHKICGELESNINHFLSKFTGIVYGGCYSSNSKIVKIIKKEKPDVVHLQCINGYFINVYRLLNWLKKNNVKTVLTLHAEFMYTGVCGHTFDCNQWKDSIGCKNCLVWKRETQAFVNSVPKMWNKMFKSFEGFNNNLAVVSVSPWLKDRAEQSTILKDKKHFVVLNGLNDDIFTYSAQDNLRKKLNLTNKKIVFHATPYFDMSPTNVKGSCYVVELARRLINKDIVFIVAGRYDKNIQIPSNIICLGQLVNQKELASYYSMADATLLTSKKETFSMVTAESLCCGTPVVGFNAGAPELITIDEYSRFCEYGNVDLLETELLYVLKHGLGDKSLISSDAKKKYSKKIMCRNYLKIYEQLISER